MSEVNISEEKRLPSLYFGGGTPALTVERIKEIIDAVQEHFIITEGIGVELHPDNVTPTVLQTLRDAGVTKSALESNPSKINSKIF